MRKIAKERCREVSKSMKTDEIYQHHDIEADKPSLVNILARRLRRGHQDNSEKKTLADEKN